jgi:hypothetical protein
MIYFIQAADGSGPIKIGYTGKNLEQRIWYARQQAEKELKIIKVIDGSRALEQGVHKHFAHLRIEHPSYKEWYEPQIELLDFIKNPVEVKPYKKPEGPYYPKSDRQCLAAHGIFRCASAALVYSDFCTRHTKYPPKKLATSSTPQAGTSLDIQRWGNPNKDVTRRFITGD